MENITYLVVLIVTVVISLVATIFISLKKEVKKIYKYLPAIIVLSGSVIYCLLMTIVNYNRYIGILYVIVFITTIPGFVICLLTAIVFDSIRFFSRRKSKNKTKEQL